MPASPLPRWKRWTYVALIAVLVVAAVELIGKAAGMAIDGSRFSRARLQAAHRWSRARARINGGTSAVATRSFTRIRIRAAAERRRSAALNSPRRSLSDERPPRHRRWWRCRACCRRPRALASDSPPCRRSGAARSSAEPRRRRLYSRSSGSRLPAALGEVASSSASTANGTMHPTENAAPVCRPLPQRWTSGQRLFRAARCGVLSASVSGARRARGDLPSAPLRWSTAASVTYLMDRRPRERDATDAAW
jgi:hypothetical protein